MEKEYYIHAKNKGYLGNYCYWWGKNRRGYYPDLQNAGRYSHEEAMEITDNGTSDEKFAYECDYVEQNMRAVKTVVDPHYLDKDKSLCTAKK